MDISTSQESRKWLATKALTLGLCFFGAGCNNAQKEAKIDKNSSNIKSLVTELNQLKYRLSVHEETQKSVSDIETDGSESLSLLSTPKNGSFESEAFQLQQGTEELVKERIATLAQERVHDALEKHLTSDEVILFNALNTAQSAVNDFIASTNSGPYEIEIYQGKMRKMGTALEGVVDAFDLFDKEELNALCDAFNQDSSEFHALRESLIEAYQYANVFKNYATADDLTRLSPEDTTAKLRTYTELIRLIKLHAEMRELEAAILDGFNFDISLQKELNILTEKYNTGDPVVTELIINMLPPAEVAEESSFDL